MKKVLNITIGGLVFTVEEDAYEALCDYLDSIKAHFKKDKDGDEIVEDIEASIAEKFGRRKNKEAAITNRDVASVTNEMGSLKDFKKLSDEEDEEENEKTAEKTEKRDFSKRKLYRDPDDVIIAGVASGLAAYLGIETVFMRLIFFVSVFFGGLGIVVYVLLWILMPVAENTAQKLEMRGERLTLHEIEKSVKKEVDKLKKKDLSSVKNGAHNAEVILQRIFAALGQIFWILEKLIRNVVGFGLVLASISSVFLLSFGLTWQISGGVIPYSPYALSDVLILTPNMQMAFLAGVYFTVLVPLLLLFFLGYSLLRKKVAIKDSSVLLLLVLWFAALGVTGSVLFANWETIEPFLQMLANEY